jgi:hypothetical protein
MVLKKDKRGIVAFYLLMLGVVLFFLGLALAPVITESLGEVRANLNCSAPTSNAYRILCYQVDAISPLFIGVIFGLAGVLLGRIMM